jgi:hypothetical protein
MFANGTIIRILDGYVGERDQVIFRYVNEHPDILDALNRTNTPFRTAPSACPVEDFIKILFAARNIDNRTNPLRVSTAAFDAFVLALRQGVKNDLATQIQDWVRKDVYKEYVFSSTYQENKAAAALAVKNAEDEHAAGRKRFREEADAVFETKKAAILASLDQQKASARASAIAQHAPEWERDMRNEAALRNEAVDAVFASPATKTKVDKMLLRVPKKARHMFEMARDFIDADVN